MSHGAGNVPLRALTGIVRLTAREVVVRGLGFCAAIFLARMLSPAAFGLIAMSTFAVGLFGLFNDLGLGAALIRRHGNVSANDLNAVFTFQLLWLGLLATAIVMVAPVAGHLYGEPVVTWLVRVLAVSFVLVSLRSVPIVVAERGLDYGPVALADIGEQLTYSIVAITGAVAGLGVWSLVLAIVSSAAVGTVTLYARTPWRPALQLEWLPIRDTLRFGLLYQGQNLAHFIRDTTIPAWGGVAYGAASVGYLSWAFQLASVPLLLTHLVSRVSYPALSKLQNDRDAFLRMVETTLRWTCKLSFPAFAVLGGLAPQIVLYIFGSQWIPAIPALYFLLTHMALSIGTGVLLPALYVYGRSVLALSVSTGWAIVTWVMALGLYLTGAGFGAVAVAQASATASALVVVVLSVHRLGPVNLLNGTWFPITTAVISALCLHFALQVFVHSVWSLGVLGLAAGTCVLSLNLWGDYRLILTVATSYWHARTPTHVTAI